MIHWLKLLRIGYAVPITLTLALTVYYAVGAYVPILPLACVAFLLVLSGGYVINDVYDLHSDFINAPKKPIASRKIKKQSAAVVGAVMILVGCALSFFCTPEFATNLCTVAVMLILYDMYSKRIGVWKLFYAAVLMTYIYPLAISIAGPAIKQSPRALSFAFFASWMFLSTLAYEILTDIRDMEGDKKQAGRIFHLQKHPHRWRIVSNVLIVAGLIILGGAMLGGCKWLFGVLLVLPVSFGIISVFQPARRAVNFIYAEFFTVGIAATLDVFILGV